MPRNALYIPERVLAAASMAGGAMAIGPVIKRLREKGHNVYVISHGAATSSFKSQGIEPDRLLQTVSRSELYGILKAHGAPHSLLTGTQCQSTDCPVTVEQLLWDSARSRAVRSVAVLDTWANYSVRFSDLDLTSDVPTASILRPLSRLPDKIAIMDEFAMGQMLAEGFPEDRLVVTGQPQFEAMLAEAGRLPTDARQKLLAKPVFSSFFKDESAKLVVFISDSMAVYPDIGFTEQSVMRSFLQVLEDVASLTHKLLNVVVRPHPFRNAEAAEGFATDTPSIRKVRIILCPHEVQHLKMITR